MVLENKTYFNTFHSDDDDTSKSLTNVKKTNENEFNIILNHQIALDNEISMSHNLVTYVLKEGISRG